jgi:uncharacterized protein (UPF0218 family)
MDKLIGNHPPENIQTIHGNQTLRLESLEVADKNPLDGKAKRQAHYHQSKERERKDHKANSDCGTIAKVAVTIIKLPKDYTVSIKGQQRQD